MEHDHEAHTGGATTLVCTTTPAHSTTFPSQAEHLSFPLQVEPKSRTSNLELAAKFKVGQQLFSALWHPLISNVAYD